jgi:hypothetical protein
MYSGQTFDFEHEGKQFRAFIESNHDAGTPWHREDCHVDVSEWERRNKRPSEVIINEDRGSRRFVCIREAIAKATREGWGLHGAPLAALEEKLGRKPTKREVIAESVRLDVERMQEWCAGQWEYIGVCVCLLDSEGSPIGDKYAAACWGIESDSDDYIREVARDMARDAMAEAQSTAARINSALGV